MDCGAPCCFRWDVIVFHPFPSAVLKLSPSGGCVSKGGHKISQTGCKNVMAKKKKMTKIQQNTKTGHTFLKQNIRTDYFSMSLIISFFFSSWDGGRAVFLPKYSQLKRVPSKIPWNEVRNGNSNTEPDLLLFPNLLSLQHLLCSWKAQELMIFIACPARGARSYNSILAEGYSSLIYPTIEKSLVASYISIIGFMWHFQNTLH